MSARDVATSTLADHVDREKLAQSIGHAIHAKGHIPVEEYTLDLVMSHLESIEVNLPHPAEAKAKELYDVVNESRNLSWGTANEATKNQFRKVARYILGGTS